MAALNLDVRWAKEDDLPAVVAFWHHQFGFGSVQATPGRAEWLFAGQPCGLHIAMATSSDGRVVAACGHVVQNVEVPGVGPCEAAFGLDFMVDPAFRRQGLGARMLDLRLARFRLSLSTGQSDEMAALYRNRGALDLGRFHLARYRRRVALAGGPRDALRDAVTLLHGYRRPKVRGRREVEAEGVTAAGGNQAWLAWRFRGSVYRDYRIQRLTGEHGVSLLVTRLEGLREVLVHLTGSTSRTAALAIAAGTCPTGQLDALFCGRRLGAEFVGAGFMVRPHGARLIGLTNDPRLRNHLMVGSINLFSSSADADLVRKPPS